MKIGDPNACIQTKLGHVPTLHIPYYAQKVFISIDFHYFHAVLVAYFKEAQVS